MSDDLRIDNLLRLMREDMTHEQVWDFMNGVAHLIYEPTPDASRLNPLFEAPPSEMSTIGAIALLRATYPLRDAFSVSVMWHNFCQATKDYFESKGLDSKELLQGLI